MHHSLQNGTPSTHTTRFSNLHFQTYICLMQAFHSGRKANALAGVQGQSISRKRGSEQWQLLPLRGCAGVRVCWEPLSLFKSCEVFILYVTELFCCTIINFFCSDTHSIKKKSQAMHDSIFRLPFAVTVASRKAHARRTCGGGSLLAFESCCMKHHQTTPAAPLNGSVSVSSQKWNRHLYSYCLLGRAKRDKKGNKK